MLMRGHNHKVIINLIVKQVIIFQYNSESVWLSLKKKTSYLFKDSYLNILIFSVSSVFNLINIYKLPNYFLLR